jgi:hypothetical protein
MALADSVEAIGATTELLQTQLQSLTKVSVEVGRPDVAAGTTGRKLNLFLYRIQFDGSLRNLPLDDGQAPPLWLVLHYLLTAFEDKDSDSVKAHRLLGKGLAALQALAVIRPPDTNAPLAKNPQPLKITFDEADAELLSKVMQGSDEKYRVSAAFQVRPVMVMPDVPPAFAPAVKTVGFNPPPGGPLVLPTLGGRLERLEPEVFEAGALLTLSGADLEGYTDALIGGQSFPVASAPGGAKTFTLPAATTLSAGAHPIVLARDLDATHRLTSNAVLGHLLPVVTGVALGPLTPLPGGPPVLLRGAFTISGSRLGGPKDAVLVALYGGGKAAWMLEVAGTAAQTSLAVTVEENHALPAGDYALIVRVNGEQAAETLMLSWT